MKLSYQVHYNKGDALDYRSYMSYVLIFHEYATAEKIMNQIKAEGHNPVMIIKPYFDEDYNVS